MPPKKNIGTTNDSLTAFVARHPKHSDCAVTDAYVGPRDGILRFESTGDCVDLNIASACCSNGPSKPVNMNSDTNNDPPTKREARYQKRCERTAAVNSGVRTAETAANKRTRQSCMETKTIDAAAAAHSNADIPTRKRPCQAALPKDTGTQCIQLITC
jgi:hypothetical protein